MRVQVQVRVLVLVSAFVPLNAKATPLQIPTSLHGSPYLPKPSPMLEKVRSMGLTVGCGDAYGSAFGHHESATMIAQTQASVAWLLPPFN